MGLMADVKARRMPDVNLLICALKTHESEKSGVEACRISGKFLRESKCPVGPQLSV